MDEICSKLSFGTKGLVEGIGGGALSFPEMRCLKGTGGVLRMGCCACDGTILVVE